jgi:membrane protein insertase Oxa1/YidC/SpoIIIJ
MWINKLFKTLAGLWLFPQSLQRLYYASLPKKSTDSMKKMQELAPEVKKLQENTG